MNKKSTSGNPKPQPFKFSSYDDFMDHLKPEEKKIVLALNELVESCIPNSRRKLSYNVPYYSVNRRICFIWPASVPWGKVPLKGVQLGFCEGFRLRDEEGFLDRGTRKQVYTKTYFNRTQVEHDTDLLRLFLFEAAALDQEFKPGGKHLKD